jgi:hypothetical protein
MYIEYRVTPSSPKVTVVKGGTLRLTCEGRVPVGLQGFLDDSKATVILNEIPSAEYKYSVSYDFKGTEDSSVSCVDLKTKASLHTWTARVICKQLVTNNSMYEYEYMLKYVWISSIMYICMYDTHVCVPVRICTSKAEIMYKSKVILKS